MIVAVLWHQRSARSSVVRGSLVELFRTQDDSEEKSEECTRKPQKINRPSHSAHGCCLRRIWILLVLTDQHVQLQWRGHKRRANSKSAQHNWENMSYLTRSKHQRMITKLSGVPLPSNFSRIGLDTWGPSLRAISHKLLTTCADVRSSCVVRSV
jgi:hypothetical protein